MSERETLRQEVARHAERVREIVAALQHLEADAAEDERAREAGLLRMELVGRTAAVELGTARLKFLRD